ncbi:MAG: putative bifunctional diguanylate cyclase/phosphodiesterase [Methylomonas sp.]
MNKFDVNRLSFTTYLVLCTVLLLSMSATFVCYVWSEKQIDAANLQRYSTRLLIDELRQSSDDLTRMVRSYVVTADPDYLKYFQDILAIRDGKKVRPRDYDAIYWDFITGGQQPTPPGEGVLIALLDMMQQTGFTEQEISKLKEAKKLSDALTSTEFKAMRLIAANQNKDLASAEEARMLVFDDNYHRQKAAIMRPINDVIQMTNARTQQAVESAELRALHFRYMLVGLGLLLLILLAYTDRLFRRILGGSLQQIYQQIIHLGTGNYVPVIGNADNTPQKSVMGYLLETLRLLQNLEEARQRNEQSLRLAAKVFSDAQEGIFFADHEGIIIDANQAFLDMTGFSQEEVVGRQSTIFDSDLHDPAFIANMWDAIKRDSYWRGEIWSRKKNGEIFPELLSMTPVYDNDENLLCYLGMLTDITELKQHQQQMEHIAFHDPLTHLPNRQLLSDRLQRGLARAERTRESIAVACLDLDGFKEVNDNFGHGIGDALLIEVANRLLRCIRTGDTVARMGGDEFVILLCEITSQQHCETTLQRILIEMATPFSLGGDNIATISGSIGYTLFPEDNTDADTLLRHADQAMYAAKQAGKNRFRLFDVMGEKRCYANTAVISRIETALKNQELQLYIQPKIDLRNGKVVGGEALIRWAHPVRGIIPPDEFLPLVEHHPLGIAIGEWVIGEALRLMRLWSTQGIILPLSVNISIDHLKHDNFYARLAALLQEFPDIPPQHLEIELMESAALEDIHKTNALIHHCKGLGLRFALDDFGNGCSSLTYLKHLSVDTLKIDRPFVHDMLENEDNQAIVRGAISLAQAFCSQSVAKGVESWQHAALLSKLGCDIAQGHAIAAPMPAEAIPDWIKSFTMPTD